MTRAGSWIQTHTGEAYWPAHPLASEVHLEDIAHALSNLCRFGGHCRTFYSVAEHSVLVSQVVPPEHALVGLMHDATEAYVVDVPRPVKQMLGLPYAALENANWHAIAERFSLPREMPPAVKDADNAVLLAERDALLGKTPIEWEWAKGLKPARVIIAGMSPSMAKRAFLSRYAQLVERRVALA